MKCDFVITKEADRLFAGEFLLRKKGFNVIIVEDNMNLIRDFVIHYEPGALILPVVHEKYTPFDVITNMKYCYDPESLAVFAVGERVSTVSRNYVIKKGVDCVFDTRNGVEYVVSELAGYLDVVRENTMCKELVLRHTGDEFTVEDYLVECHIPLYTKGYRMLEESISLGLEMGAERKCVSGKILPIIAKSWGLSIIEVDRHIWTAIKMAFDSLSDTPMRTEPFRQGMPTVCGFVKCGVETIRERQSKSCDIERVC